MALGYLGAVMRRDGHRVTLRDQPGAALTNAETLDEISRLRPDLLGISALTGAWSNTAALMRQVRTRWPRMKVVMGVTILGVAGGGFLLWRRSRASE